VAAEKKLSSSVQLQREEKVFEQRVIERRTGQGEKK
jgi:hypothetical protein